RPPTTGERPPTTGEASPTAGERPPMTGEAPPTAGEASPTAGERSPMTGEASPTAAAVRDLVREKPLTAPWDVFVLSSGYTLARTLLSIATKASRCGARVLFEPVALKNQGPPGPSTTAP